MFIEELYFNSMSTSNGFRSEPIKVTESSEALRISTTGAGKVSAW